MCQNLCFQEIYNKLANNAKKIEVAHVTHNYQTREVKSLNKQKLRLSSGMFKLLSMGLGKQNRSTAVGSKSSKLTCRPQQ